MKKKYVASSSHELRAWTYPGPGLIWERRKPLKSASLYRRVAPEEILVGVVSHAGSGRRFVESVDGLVARVVAEMIDEDSPGRERFVAVAAEDAAAAVSHGDRPPRVVDADSRIRLEHARHGAISKERGRHGIVVDPFAPPGDFAEEEPFVEPVVDVIAFAPAAAVAGQFQRRGGPRAKLRFQRSENRLRPRVFIVGGVTGQADAPVLVAVPAVVEHVRLRADIGVDRLVHVLVKPFPLLRRPVLVTQVVDDRTAGQVVGERDVAFPDRTVHCLQGHVNRLPSERLDPARSP